MRQTRRWMLGSLIGGFLLACSGPGALLPVEIPADKQNCIGHWEGAGVVLTITSHGNLSYERAVGAGFTELNAPIQAWGDDWFEAGIGPMKTRFQIDQAPHQADGTWHMTLDGIELRRIM